MQGILDTQYALSGELTDIEYGWAQVVQNREMYALVYLQNCKITEGSNTQSLIGSF